jgi:hypothetical protein
MCLHQGLSSKVRPLPDQVNAIEADSFLVTATTAETIRCT